MRFADPPQHDTGSPFPPTFSRLSADPRPDVGDSAPTRPYYGPAGPAPRAGKRREGTGGTGAGSPRAERRAATPAPPLLPVADRTAAHGVPLVSEPDDAGAGAGAALEAHAGTGRDAGVGAPPRPAAGAGSALADLVADRLEQLASRLRAHGDPRLAVATTGGEPLDAVVAGIVGDYLRDQGA